MRITGNRLIDVAAAATIKHQSTVAAKAAEVSSGIRVADPSDDPTAWLMAHRASMRRVLSTGTGVAMQASRERLEQTDGALSTIGEVVSSVRALVIQGASATYNATDRAELGDQVRALFASALGAANTKASDGEFLLAGAASLTQPFGATGIYQGDGNVRAVPTGETATSPVTIAGSELTAAQGVDVLPLLDRLATALSANDVTTLVASLPDLDTAIKQVSSSRSHTGGAMNVLDEAKLAHTALEASMEQTISRSIESDTVTAASELAQASQALEVSRAVSSHIVAMLAQRA